MPEYWYTIGAIIGMGAWVPWVVLLFLRLFRRGKLDFYETYPIQIGYTSWGPVMLLEGVMRATGKDLFLTKASLSLTKHKDNSNHTFEAWLLQAGMLPANLIIKENWRSFYPVVIQTFQSQLYGIMFTEPSNFKEIRNLANNLNGRWYEEREKASPVSPYAPPELLREAFDTFRKGKAFLEAFDDINRLYYWEAGDYSLELKLFTSKPDKTFQKKWQFVLKKEQAKKLALNVSAILEEACGFPASFQYFYEPAELVEIT